MTPQPSHNARPRPKILVVEDNAALSAMLRNLLERSGWWVEVAQTLVEAHEQLSTPPECVILDLGLPDGEGEDLLRRLRDERPETRVVVVTGVLDERRLEAVRRLGAAVVLHKPVSFSDLVSHISV